MATSQVDKVSIPVFCILTFRVVSEIYVWNWLRHKLANVQLTLVTANRHHMTAMSAIMTSTRGLTNKDQDYQQYRMLPLQAFYELGPRLSSSSLN